MAKCGNFIPTTPDFQPMTDYDRDIQITELKRTVELLQRQLNQQNNNQSRRNRQDEYEDQDYNPFGEVEDSSDEDCNYRAQRRQPRQNYGDVKVDVTKFDGKMQGDAFLDWLFTVERNFEFKKFAEERKVKLVTIKLKGYASLWWENLRRERNREGRRHIQTWEKMKRELKKRFMSENYRQDNYKKFYNFKQYNLPVEEYIREFQYLMLRCDIREPEEQTIARFLGGLKREISDAIQLQPFWTFNDIRKLSINIEKQQARYAPKSAPKVSSSNEESVSSSLNTSFFKGTTHNKNKLKKDEGTSKKLATNSNSTKKYFKCQGYGHITSDCPNRKVVTIIEEEITENKSEANNEEENLEEVTEYADEGDVLVIRRSLNVIHEDDTTRNYIFSNEI